MSIEISVPNLGQALIAFAKAQRHAESRYNDLQNCKSCDKEVAQQWKRDMDFFAHLVSQLKEQVNG